MLRLGMVESISTPTAINPGLTERISFNGETIFGHDSREENGSNDQIPIALRPGAPFRIESHSNESRDTLNSSNNPDSTLLGLTTQLSQVTRSSYMTTSDLSGLSDFPIPPKSVHSEHDPNVSFHPTPSFFKSNFDGERQMEHAGSSLPPRSTSPTAENVRMPLLDHSLPHGGPVEFGSNQSADELALSLSSPYPFAT